MKIGCVIRPVSAVFIALCMVLSLSCAAASGAAYADESVSLPTEIEGQRAVELIAPVSDIKTGDEVYLNINVDDAENMFGFEAEITYDSEKLTFKEASCGYDDGEGIEIADSSQPGKIRYAFSSDKTPQDFKSTLVTFAFTANQTGTVEFEMSNVIIVNDDMSYESYPETKRVSLTITSQSSGTNSGSSGGSSGGSGGSGGWGSGVIVSGGGTSITTSTVPSTSPLPEPTPNIGGFTDLSEAEWAVEAITYLTDLGIINGYIDEETGEQTFRPNNPITRAEFTKIIVMSFALSAGENAPQFSDVSSEDWFYQYVTTAAELGIVNGYEDGAFLPDNNITREEMSAVIVRAVEAAGVELGASRLNINFADEGDISEYAVGYIDSLYTAGIINGDENNMFRPQDNLTRAEAAKVLHSVLTINNSAEEATENE